MTRNDPKLRGFTIIEVVIAIFILGVGILGVSTFYSASIRTIRIARDETAASNLAAGLLDESISNTFDNLAVGIGTKVRYSDIPTDPFHKWSKKIDILYIDSTLAETATPTNMKKVVVTVYWTEGTSEKNFQTASIKARH